MITVTSFGKINNKDVNRIELANDNGMRAAFISFGAAIQTVIVPDKEGKPVDIALGYETPEEYRDNGGYVGMTIGRCANRISNAAFDLDGKHYVLPANEKTNQLHGGPDGFSFKVWDFVTDEKMNRVTFSCFSPDGEMGYPGNLKASVSFTLKHDNRMVIDYRAETDADTVVNMTNHWYFNLSGQGNGNILDHVLQCSAEKTTPTGALTIPTGEIISVTGTPVDFRKPTAIEKRMDQLISTDLMGYDHNLVLGNPGNMKKAANLLSPETGIFMDLATNQEAVQLYTGNHLTERKGKCGKSYTKFSGMCLETQHFPNAINTPSFPSPVLKAGEKYEHRAEFSFYI